MCFEYTTGVIADLSIEDLQQRRANTWETYGNCLGHGKSHYNHLILGLYDTELASRGVAADETIQGVFKGTGTY